MSFSYKGGALLGKKLTIFLIDGSEIGPRTVEIGNWSGKGIYSQRINLGEIISRPEFDKPGIYILKSDPRLSIYSERIYIGEAEKLGQRIKRHLVTQLSQSQNRVNGKYSVSL